MNLIHVVSKPITFYFLIMKKHILNLGKALNKKQLKEVKGGTFFHRRTGSGTWCKYSCTLMIGSGRASLDGGQSQSCYLELPYFVYNHPVCRPSNGGGDGPIDGPMA